MPYTSRAVGKQTARANAFTKTRVDNVSKQLRCYTCNKPFDGTRQAYKIAPGKYQCTACQGAKI
jgi:predicted SprT family Zn-dependent metalloprotease